MDPFCVKWVHPLMQRDDSADPDHLKVPGKKGCLYTADQLMEALGEEELFTMEWYLHTSHVTGMKKRTFMDKLAEIKDDKSKLTKTAEDKWKAVNPIKQKEKVGAEVQ